MVPTMVLVADGSHDGERLRSLQELSRAVSERDEAEVIGAFEGNADRVVEKIDGPVVVVPAFLAGEDAAGAAMVATMSLEERFDSCAIPPLGATPSVVSTLFRRLGEAGWRPGDGVVLAADGAVASEERNEVVMAARRLSRYTRTPVQTGYVSDWGPTVAEAAQRLRRVGYGRVAVASWRLAGGATDPRVTEVEASAVSAPLWPTDFVVDALWARHRAAALRLSA
jgi:sirohydrochlorin ferrochelatase